MHCIASSVIFQVFESYYQPNTMNISLEAFMRDFFVAAWDLRCYRGPSNPNALPLLRSGELKLNVRFSEALKSSITLLVFTWSPSLLTCSKEGAVSVSYRQ